MTGAWVRHVARVVLGGFLLVAGVAHLVDVEAFLAQVPPWLPAREAVVLVSGVVELALGAALLLARGRRRAQVGVVVAAFLVAVFPGNVSQWLTGADAFGLETDGARLARLFFQPPLVAWALWCTGGWGLLVELLGRRRGAGEGPVRPGA